MIFIDDDILVPSDLVRQHVEAHILNPGAVIFGGCVPPPGAQNHVGRLLASLYGSRPGHPRFERVSIIASGQLSVERKSFPHGVYASQLRTPAAEEFELSARLAQQGILAIKATQIEAIHDQRFEILNVCAQHCQRVERADGPVCRCNQRQFFQYHIVCTLPRRSPCRVYTISTSPNPSRSLASNRSNTGPRASPRLYVGTTTLTALTVCSGYLRSKLVLFKKVTIASDNKSSRAQPSLPIWPKAGSDNSYLAYPRSWRPLQRSK